PKEIREERLRTDGNFDFAAARFHAFECLRQISKTDFFRDEILRGDIAPLHSFERFANESRRVMERRDEPDFRIVDLRRFDGYLRAGWQATEEIHDTAAPHHGKRHFPS